MSDRGADAVSIWRRLNFHLPYWGVILLIRDRVGVADGPMRVEEEIGRRLLKLRSQALEVLAFGILIFDDESVNISNSLLVFN